MAPRGLERGLDISTPGYCAPQEGVLSRAGGIWMGTGATIMWKITNLCNTIMVVTSACRKPYPTGVAAIGRESVTSLGRARAGGKSTALAIRLK